MLNTLRQLGGSLGVAIMTTILTTRITYHTQIFGGAIQKNSQALQNTMGHLSNYVQHHVGASHGVASQLSNYLLMANVKVQGYIEGINDVFLVATVLTLLELIPVFFLRGKKKKQQINH